MKEVNDYFRPESQEYCPRCGKNTIRKERGTTRDSNNAVSGYVVNICTYCDYNWMVIV